MKQIALSLLLSMFCFSCKSQSKPLIPKGKFTNKINLSGFFINDKDGLVKSDYYEEYSNAASSYKFIFFGNGICNYSYGGTVDSAYYEQTLMKKMITKDCYGCSGWGKYRFSGDTIKVHFRYQFYSMGLRMKYYDTHFQGIMKTNNTIVDWKMVPPYPDPKIKWNETFEDLKKPKKMIFISFPAKKLIDSNNVWINDYDENYWKF